LAALLEPLLVVLGVGAVLRLVDASEAIRHG
jgi:hypothetical protein